MFGIGLPEMLVILAVALIVVGPDKLPDLARSLAKGVFELKKTVNQVKNSLADEDDLLDSVRSDLRKTTEDLKENLLETDHFTWHEKSPSAEISAGEEETPPSAQTSAGEEEDIDGGERQPLEGTTGREDPLSPGGTGQPEDDPSAGRYSGSGSSQEAGQQEPEEEGTHDGKEATR